MFRNPILWIVIVLSGMLAIAFWPSEQKSEMRRGGGSILIEVAEAKTIPYNEEIAALGTAQANESIDLKANSTDRVDIVHFDDGQFVEAGQLLVTMRHDEEKANVNEFKATLNEHRRQLKRLKDLEKQSATAASAIEKQESLIESTEAQQQVAKVRLDEKFIKAPFSGQVGLRQISPGQLITTSTNIVTLDDVNKIKVEFQLSEKYLTAVEVGQQVSAMHVAFKAPFVGVIDSISSRVDKTSRAFSVRAIFNNEAKSLRPGMLLQIKVTTEASNALVIPESAIIPINNQHFVYVLNGDNTVSKTEVVLGRRKPGSAEVVKGLSAGDQVVFKGVLKVRDGAQVTTPNKDA